MLALFKLSSAGHYVGMTNPQQAIDEALSALAHRNPARAAQLLHAVAGQVPEAEMPWLALANAEMALGRLDAAEAAMDRQLALDHRDIGSLLMKGMLRERRGDSRAASSFYMAAVNQQAAYGGAPAELAPLLEHAGRYVATAQSAYIAHLEASVGEGLSPAMREAIDMLAGRRGIDLQQPSLFYYPGLPQKRFYDPAEFPWLQAMLDLLPDMQAELRAVAGASGADGAGFAPYVRTAPDRPAANNPLRDDPAWSAFHFWRDGAIVEEHAALCPATMAALAHAPMPMIPGRAPTAIWSRLAPGTHIAPHNGMLNSRLICHIPIRTAPGCSFRVGSETRNWEEGVPFVFDDSMNHEARNDGPEARVVLLFEIWRPEIGAADRAAIGRVFQAIEGFGEG